MQIGTVASDGNFGENAFGGLIDELSIYNRALSATEIAAIYNAGSAGKCAGVHIAPFITSQPTNLGGSPLESDALLPAVPVITSFSPQAGALGVSVTVVGTNFSPVAANDIVYFGAVKAVVSFASPTNLVMSVPSGATYAPITVTVNGLTASASGFFLPTFTSGGTLSSSSFAARVDLPVAGSPSSVAIGDLDGDGRPEIVVADSGGNAVSVLQNQSSPGLLTTNSFGTPVNFAVGPTSFHVALADMDGDGRLDVVTANTGSNTRRVSVLRNISTLGQLTTNSLAPEVDLSGADQGSALAIGDLDGDGRLDVVTASYAGESFSVYRNLSAPGSLTTNSFGPDLLFAVGNTMQNVALGDLDGDGKPDVALVSQTTSQLSLYRNLSTPGSLTNSSFGPRINLASGSNPAMVAIGDLDGDGRPDMVVVNQFSGTLSLYHNITPLGVPPSIIMQPTNQTTTVRSNVTFTVTAAGSTPLSYQWEYNTTNLLNDTNATLTLNNVQLSQAGNYSVLVTNLYGSTNSTLAVLTVNPLPLACTPPPAGIVSWWPAEDNANDIISGNNGTLMGGVGFTNGEVGQAFSLDGSTTYVSVPASASLDIGATGSGITIKGWVKPTAATVANGAPIIEWDSATTDGLQLWCYFGQLYANIKTTSGNNNEMYSGVPMSSGVFQHVAVTYDESSGNAVLYLNGVATTTHYFGSFTPQTTFPLNIGRRTAGGWSTTFGGLIDELSIYSRALSTAEIQAIYNTGSYGKCAPAPLAPFITSQPTNLTVTVSNTAVFAVSASGTAPLAYQWAFNTTNLLNATNAILTLTNVQLGQAGNYSVLVGNLVGSTNSAAAALTIVLPPVITQQPQSQSVPSYSSASFSVAATGTGPLTYQWQKNGTNLVDNCNLSGSTTTNLTLASVSLADAGSYVVVVSSPYAATNSIPAVLTVPQTVFTLGSTNAMSGGTIVVPVWMNALGVESAFQTSIGYDPTKLVLQSIQPGPATVGDYFVPVGYLTNNGYVGFVIYDATIPSGTDEVADLIFKCLPVTNITTVNLTFGDVPVGRDVADHNLHLLPSIFQGGSVILSPGEYEADVYPRFNGDGQVTILDWLEVGRMVAGLDVPTNSDEFMRADCAPRNAPDGVLTVADWVQAGRYELGLDPLTLVTPEAVPNIASLSTKAKPLDLGGPAPMRILQIANVSAARGQTVNVPVHLVCLTGENAVGMTIGYNTNLLSFVNILMGTNIPVTGAALNLNTNQPGKLGVALALSSGTALAAGTNEVAILQFTAGAGASGLANLTFDSTVVQMQVADYIANSLATIYVNGAVVLPPQPIMSILSAAGSGSQLRLTWPLSSGTFQVQTADSPLGPWTTVVFPMVTNGANVSVMVSPTNQYQFLRLQGQ
jgi:uncharacterized protein (DUF2141 family)